MKPFNREKFLLYMLAGIFTWQAAVFTFGAISCFQKGGREACPNLGDRYENTVGIMIATTLALLGAGAVTSQKKPSVSDPASPLPLSPQAQAQGKVQELAQGSVQESVRGKGKGKNFDKAS
jgi:hypothetical protein